MTIQTGDKIPSVTLKVMTADGPKTLPLMIYLAEKKL